MQLTEVEARYFKYSVALCLPFSTLRVIMRFFLPLTAYREGNAFTGVCHSVQGGGRYVCLVPGPFGEGCACLVPASFGEGWVCLVAGHFQGVGMLDHRTLLGGTPRGGWLYQGGLGIPGGILRGGYNSCGKVMFSQVTAILPFCPQGDEGVYAWSKVPPRGVYAWSPFPSRGEWVYQDGSGCTSGYTRGKGISPPRY